MKTRQRIAPGALHQLNDYLGEAGNVVIIPHINADGDAVGSALGLMLYFRRKGFSADVISPNDYPEFLHWLPGSDHVISFYRKRKKATALFLKADLVICVDFNEIARSGDMEELLKNSPVKKVLIDHHPDTVNFADLQIVDTSAAATAELVFELIVALNDKDLIDKEIAICLATGIITDTGSFCHSAGNSRMYRIFAELLDFGVDKELIHSLVYDNFTEDRMRLMGFALCNRMVVMKEYNAAYIWLKMEDLERFDFRMGDTEGLVNLPLSIAGINLSALFMERKDHVKISFRSRSEFEVNRFAAKWFNGGGHNMAAGGQDDLPVEKALERFEMLVRNHGSH
ncbi:MAG: bifunctional oligoribonuclease/PAP phosphatase NrnA [Bacteroidetes bacterium]|nr:bifunctional oligoribonuclease/PAP phosphatase NrnA [Bacteroidota bacterium]